MTTHPSHGAELTKGFVERDVETVVAWGGDGTINEVASALAFGGTALGIVPSGSGNGLARELNVPRDPGGALRTALTGATRTIDAGELGGRLFFNVAGIGFDAHLAALFNRSSSRGGLRYVATTIRGILGYEPSYYRLRSSDVAISRTALIVALANSRQYGLNAQIAPVARPDGRLARAGRGSADVTAVSALARTTPVFPARSIRCRASRCSRSATSRLPATRSPSFTSTVRSSRRLTASRRASIHKRYGFGSSADRSQDGVCREAKRFEVLHDVARRRHAEVLRLKLDLDVVIKCCLDGRILQRGAIHGQAVLTPRGPDVYEHRLAGRPRNLKSVI